MIEEKLGPFIAVPYDAVTVNGHYMTRLNTASSPYNGHWSLIAPNGRAVDGEGVSRPFLYASLDEAREDAANLVDYGATSTCGGKVVNLE